MIRQRKAMSEKEIRFVIFKVYARGWILLKWSKVLFFIALILGGFSVFLSAWMWSSTPHTFTVWSGLFYVCMGILIAFSAIIAFGFPHRLLTVPLRKHLIPEGHVRQYYDSCVESLKLGVPIIDPKTGQLSKLEGTPDQC